MGRQLVIGEKLNNSEELAVIGGRVDAASEVLGAYLDSLARPKTRATMAQSLDRIARVITGDAQARASWIRWESFDWTHSTRLRARLIASFSPGTVEVTLCALRGILRTAWRMGTLSQEAYMRACDLPALRASRLPAGRDLSGDEIARLTAYCEAQRPPYGLFLRATFALLIGGGLRASEVCGLTENAYSGGAVRLLRKGNKEAIVPLGAAECAALDAWVAWRRELGLPWLVLRVFVDGTPYMAGPLTVKTLEHLCWTVAKAAGLERFGPHDCRRTFCTRMLSADVDLRTVQRLMGHESPETTARYDRRQADMDAEARRRVAIWGPDPNEVAPEARLWGKR